MNLTEQRISGNNQVHLTDALNAALLELKVSRNSYTQAMPDNITIYVDKQNRTNPSSERREYIFPLSRELVYLYESDVRFDFDQFKMELVVENNDINMKTYVVRNITDLDEEGNRNFATNPEIEEIESIPIILFEGENYIYTNYSSDEIDIELIYPKNTEENKILLNSAIYYSHKNKNDGEFSLDDIYFKDAFTKTEDKLNLEVDNANVACITSKNNKFSLDEDGNLTVNSVLFNNSNLQILSIYPVGSIYLSVNNVNPGTLFGGTWEQIKDIFLLGAGDIYTAGSIGGSATHTLTINEMPSHRHEIANYNSGGNAQGSMTVTANAKTGYLSNIITGATGGGQSHNNMPPYLVVYMWKRTA